jgi:hypothetical protein
MTGKTTIDILLARHFESFEELAAFVIAWDADFRQLNASRLPNSILQAQVDGVLVSLGRFGCHVAWTSAELRRERCEPSPFRTRGARR